MDKTSIPVDSSDDIFLKNFNKILIFISFLSQAMPNQMMSVKNLRSEHIFDLIISLNT